MPSTKRYGNAHISGEAHATLGDTHIYNYYYLGTASSALADHAALQVAGPPQQFGRAQVPVVVGETSELPQSSPTEQDPWSTARIASSAYSALNGTDGVGINLDSKAEAVTLGGTAASIHKIVAICNKITRRLKEINHDPSLNSFACRIELVAITIEAFHSSLSPLVTTEGEPGILKACLAHVESLLVKIDQSSATLTPLGNKNVFKNVLQPGKTRATIQRLEAHEAELNKWLNTLNLYVSSRISERSRHHESSTTTLMSETSTSSLAVRSARSTRPRKTPCEQGLCGCRCHKLLPGPRGSIVAASAYLLYRCSCQRKEIWFSMAMLQKLLSVRLALQWTNGLAMDWSLSYRNTVKKTNAGALVLYKCSIGLMGFVEAQTELTRLRIANQLDFADIDPNGDGLCEIAIRYPWSLSSQDVQLQLFRWLVDAGTPVNSERLLQTWLTWTRWKSYSRLLKTLLACSVDASDVSPRLLSAWQRAAKPLRKNDQFYLKTVSLLIENDYDFGGSTKLHTAVLRSDYALVQAILEKDRRQANTDKNFLGQHALHLAVSNPKMVAVLLEHCSEIELDIPDIRQSTPLMYAVAYGATSAAKLLLEGGADPYRHDQHNGFCAWDYAMVYRGPAFSIELLECYRSSAPTSIDNAVAFCLTRRILDQFWAVKDYGCKLLSYLLQFDCGHKLVTDHDNTLLHLCRRDEAVLLLHHKRFPVDQKNAHGYTPLMVMTRYQDPLLVREVIDQGATIGITDEKGRNCLHHLHDSLARDAFFIPPDSWLRTTETAAILLASGINVKQADSCRCLCSSSGCVPLLYLFSACHHHETQLGDLSVVPWCLEWLILLWMSRPQEVKGLAMALYRRQRFDELGMTHTCCLRPRTPTFSSRRADGWISPRECAKGWHSDEADGQCEEESDTEEIWDEEKSLAAELREDCEIFLTDVETDPDAAWVGILARRAVMLDEVLAKTTLKYEERSRMDALAHEKLRDDLERDGVEIITESPLRWVDRKADTIREDYGPSDGWSDLSTNCNLQYHVKKYLRGFEGHSNCITKHFDNFVDPTMWAEMRRSLASQLLEEAARLREAPKEERDWELRVEDE